MDLIRKFPFFTLIFLSGWLGTAFMMHKFYLSLTEVRYDQESSTLQISMRIFPDDMDRALMEHFGVETHLETRLEAPSADSLLSLYIRDHFTLLVNGEELPFHFLGKEPEADAVWCYLESEPATEPVHIEVTSRILTDVFEKQVNIIQVYVGSFNKGLLLTRDEPSGSLAIR